MKPHHTLCLLLLAALLLAACGSAKHLREAQQSLARGEYYDAARHYKSAYAKTPPKERATRGRLAFMQGECYRRINYTLRAKAAYLNAARYHYPDSVLYLQLAETLRKNGEYGAAIPHYQTFLSYLERQPAPATPDKASAAAALHAAADNGLASCRTVQAWKNHPTRYKVRRATVFQSRRADYSPMYAGADADLLYFTSTRNEAKGAELNGITGMKSADLFQSKRDDKGRWQKPQPIDSEVNSEWEEGACSFSPDGKTLYFTRCRVLPNAPAFAEIYVSQRSGAQWGAPQRCAVTADTLSSFAHPAVSPDGRYLYFTSDMPGGFGGLDLWRINFTPTGFGYVDNLGADINTAGNEQFPTFAPDGTLYFSSDGHLGLGGLDIFRAQADSLRSGHWKVENLRFPVNSQADDFGMTFEPGAPHRGFFSSNRGDARGWDHLFSFELPQTRQLIVGTVFDKEGEALGEATVTVAGDDGTFVKLGVKRDGSFTHAVRAGHRYALSASARGYLNHQEEVISDTLEVDTLYRLAFPLTSITRPVLIENIFYAFNRADLTAASSSALNELIALLRLNSHITVELSAHCDYKGDSLYNERLSQRRAEAVVRYLIKGGIDPARLTAKGYGESVPKTVTKQTLQAAPFLHEGDVLTEDFIKKLPPEQQEPCNAINRRTEFRVTGTRFGL
ncbi:MAG: OmpA family protein [Prevotellaceae bacterium]|jgi:outer membrane protein OmpA-like peptidoglycan-associated protein|nr:OmpA family protein [Prevotellaceae bacterium]